MAKVPLICIKTMILIPAKRSELIPACLHPFYSNSNFAWYSCNFSIKVSAVQGRSAKNSCYVFYNRLLQLRWGLTSKKVLYPSKETGGLFVFV